MFPAVFAIFIHFSGDRACIKDYVFIDPCCGSGGFFLAANDFISQQYALDVEQRRFLKNETFFGTELVATTYKMCLMNLYLHNIGDIYGNVPVDNRDSLAADASVRVDYVLTNPPLGKKSSISTTTEDDETVTDELTYSCQDFWTSTSNKQLNFIQYIYTMLKSTGKAGWLCRIMFFLKAAQGK